MKRLLDLLDRDPKRVVGLMSGTSVDGIDAALVEIRGHGTESRVRLLDHRTTPYARDIRDRIHHLFHGDVRDVCEMNFVLGEIFARAASEMGPVDLVGSHGQTIYHIDPGQDGTPSTLQVGEPSLIAEATGAVVVSDFRSRDIAVGGSGAPLVPYVDYLLFRKAGKIRALLNIGGIANVTVVPDVLDGVFAFDTGPGNMIIDEVARVITGGKETFDPGGTIAARGDVDGDLLKTLLEHPYLRRSPPKSTGREIFGRPFVQDLLGRARPDERLLRTVTEFTAASIADGFHRFLLPRTDLDEVIVSGGGVHNETVMASLRRHLHPVPVRDLFEVSGIPGDAKEAIAFAVLANEAIHGHPGNVPGATGASRPVVLGRIQV